MALVEEIVLQLGPADAGRLPVGVRARAERALEETAAGRARAARSARAGVFADTGDRDLLSDVTWLAVAAHDGNDHDRMPQPDGGGGCACAVSAAALAATTVWDTPGDVLVGAVALGLELQHRLAGALGSAHRAAGWDLAGTVGPPAAAAAAALVAGADPDQVAHAIGIATSLTLGHGVAVGTGAGGLHIGKAAANGLLAASLAVQGSTATTTALEGPRGYFQALGPAADPRAVLAGLGDEWRIDDQHQEAARAASDEETVLWVAATPAQTRAMAAQLLDVIRGGAA